MQVLRVAQSSFGYEGKEAEPPLCHSGTLADASSVVTAILPRAFFTALGVFRFHGRHGVVGLTPDASRLDWWWHKPGTYISHPLVSSLTRRLTSAHQSGSSLRARSIAANAAGLHPAYRESESLRAYHFIPVEEASATGGLLNRVEHGA